MNQRITKKIFDEGYKVFETCYHSCDKEVERAKVEGYEDVISYRVKSDIPYVKMFVVLVK